MASIRGNNADGQILDVLQVEWEGIAVRLAGGLMERKET